MPFLMPDFLKYLATLAYESNAEAVVPEEETRGFLEPLCAVYSPACLPHIENALRAGKSSVIAFLQSLREREALRLVKAAEWKRFDADGKLFSNLNSPDDCARAGIETIPSSTI
jgi:molybdopterin-guanine dinucleotide biosynthesis protein A